MIREADTDNDGEIDFNEFTKMILAWMTSNDPEDPYTPFEENLRLLRPSIAFSSSVWSTL